MEGIAPEDRLLTAIKKVEQATQRAKEEALAKEGIAKAQYNALLVLSSVQGITSAELARRCSVTPQAMNETVARLERQGWITRAPHPEHRHVLEARLTPTGESVL
ncbi:MAG TPA: MarR family transcriptional regulator, partial [Mycobacteriales bacterium]|nr:MarR family transcriptional regulator [Mycobacteriales bacterium]